MVDYLNSGRDTPFLDKYYEPTDPRLAVVHRSEEGMLFYKIDGKVNRLEPGGYIERQQPVTAPEAAALPHRAEPVDPAVSKPFASRALSIAEVPPVPKEPLPPWPDAQFKTVNGVGAVEARTLLRGAMAAGFVYDSATSTERAWELHQQNNATGVQSTLMHFGGRNLGALGGAVLGAELLGTLGATTGPLDVVAVALGAAGGAFVGDKAVNTYDQYTIHHQADPKGNTWRYGPEQPQYWASCVAV